jgi:phosphatidylinositol alpha-1,6-mannosyltransferase
MKQKSIFIISTEYLPGPGGIGSHAYQVTKELHKLGWKVRVFTEQTYSSDEEIIDFNNKSPFKITRLFPTPSLFLLLAKLVKLVFATIKDRPDVILGTGKHGTWFAVLVGRLTFTKTAVIGHGTEFIITMSARSKKINTWTFSSADVVIYVSNYTKKIAEQTGIFNKRSYIINNGGDKELFYPLDETQIRQFKKIKGISEQKIILTVGHVQPRKGHEFVIRAMPQILASVPNAHYYCIGPPRYLSHLQEVCKELNVESSVHFPGRIPPEELLLWLNACDVFALTSVATEYGDVEGFGIVIIEAALCAKPSVVTEDSGPGEAIIEGVTGFGVPEKDHRAIAEKIILFLKEDVLRKTMGDKARIYATENSTWAIVIKKYDEVLTGIL